MKIAAEKVAKIGNEYQEGLLSEEEKRRMIIEVWQGVKQEVENNSLLTDSTRWAQSPTW